ncbi:ArsR family transcriptional regulator [Microbacterium sp. ARD32]|uniref:ArsR/SmtB family transcription factor n=1 Tax=Microbacterium sp. ARD32 TaxID=2962577 RepID=UPI002881DEF8|nr:ArsR family transcriptional regulator [Microbacterium sp. ARD32]MDT0156193.1 ArsR family transcriptional regulator [Microbacterium sp. ARD32]
MSGQTALPHPEPEDFSLSTVLKALGDPERLTIVAQLAQGPQDIGECFRDNPNVPKSTRSHLMKVLREAGVIRNDPTPNGPGRRVTLRRDDLEARFPGLLASILASSQL